MASSNDTSSPASARALERAHAGERLSAAQAEALFGAGLVDLGRAADAACARRHPEPHRTYVIDTNINYTNVCVSGCRFCAFWREPQAPDAYVLDTEQVLAKIEQAVALGATQLLMQGGLHPTLPLDWYERLCRAIKAHSPVRVHSLSPPEIVHLAGLSGLGIEDVLRRLRDAGLDSLPGGGAEILCDRVRRALSPRKCTADQWLAVMRAAHAIGMPTTATMMFGHIETPAERVEHLMRLRDLQDETGGFTAFIAWTYQPLNTALGGRAAGGHDYLRTLAVSRLALDNFDNVQASWVTQGPKIAQVALRFGANDLGGTTIEENVVRAAGACHRMTPDDMAHLIQDAGFEPRQRDTLYRLIE